MRRFRLGVGMVFVSCLLAGCDGDSGESTATPESPQSGLDAVKKLQGPPKATSKGLLPAVDAGGATPTAPGAAKPK
jgi:hypothetical protein